MTIARRILLASLLLALGLSRSAHAVELKVNRGAIDRTLKQQLFGGPDGRFYLKGDAKSPCYAYVDDPQVLFGPDRILVQLKTHAKLGKAFGSSCFGITLNLPTVVSLAPDAEGEVVGFRDAKLDKITDQKELNFILAPFLSRQVPSSMKVNAADLLRKSLAGSTANSGYKISLDRLKIQNIHIEGENLVVDGDGDISVQ
jgi:hypothetical protein